jgi:hypothetical protein
VIDGLDFLHRNLLLARKGVAKVAFEDRETARKVRRMFVKLDGALTYAKSELKPPASEVWPLVEVPKR